MVKDGEKFVAVGLFTQADLDLWGNQLRNVYRLDDTPDFDELLRNIDRATSQSGPDPDAA